MTTVIFPSNHPDFNSRQIFCSPSLNQHHIMLLKCVSFPRNECNQLFSITQTNSTALPICRVRLFGFSDNSLQNDALHLRPATHGTTWSRFLFHRALSDYLVHGSAAHRRRVYLPATLTVEVSNCSPFRARRLECPNWCHVHPKRTRTKKSTPANHSFSALKVAWGRGGLA